ncbi:MAG: tetratricopeptide repeat protein [Brevinematales bacterium]|nr:tetratricopeptide repeat protein [Brevinematales bacterium]
MGNGFLGFGNQTLLILLLIAALILGGFLIFFKVLVYLSKQKKINISEDLLKKGQFEEVLRVLKDIIKSNSGTYLQMHYIAQAYEGLGNIEKAIDYYEKCVVRMPLTESDFKDVLFMKIARLYYRIGKFQESLGFFESVVSKKTTSRYVYYEISLVLFELEKYSAVEKNLETYLRFAPGDVNAMLLQGKTFYSMHSFQKAAGVLQTIIPELGKISVEKGHDCKLYLGLAYYHLKKYPQSIEQFESLTADGSSIAEYFFEYFSALCYSDQIDSAAKLLSDNSPALDNTVRHESLYLIGTLLWRKKLYRKAVTYWKILNNENPEFKDIGELKKKYSPLVESQVFDFLYTDDESVEKNIRAALTIPKDNFIIKRENYWIIYDQTRCFILNRTISPFTSTDMDDCASQIQENRLSNNDCTLLSYLYVDEQSRQMKVFNQMESFAEKRFLNFFFDKMAAVAAPESDL